ncbi:hypothetical protein [uncultured Shewanella sp.]|uniref:hypothetical protein n=1 Tax=uncultured Shewanella sp. TaxID=173975 RepID=UPI00262F65BD|nr:hypothetical protein [uncultured Shewanella sp.]
MKYASLFWPTCVFGLLFSLTCSAQTELLYSQSEHCPAGFRLAAIPTQAPQLQAMCDQIGPWDIVRLAHQGSISGSGYGCHIIDHDTRGLGHSLCTPVDIQIVTGQTCPEHYSLVTPNEVRANTSQYCDMLAPTSAVLLSDNTRLSGIAGHCDMHSLALTDTNTANTNPIDEVTAINTALCARDDRIKSQADCPIGTEFLLGSNTPNYCIDIHSTSRWDHLGTDMCQAAGKGDFVAIKPIFFSRMPMASQLLLDDNNQIVEARAGQPTLICSERPLPTYSASGHIVSCPLGAEIITGQSAATHCAYIWGTPGLDTSGNEVCKQFGGFKEYIYRIPRSPMATSFTTFANPLVNVGDPNHYETVVPNASRIALCQQELAPTTDDDGKIIACPAYAELILSASAGNHCALLSGDPGYDIDNDQDVCQKAEQGDFVRYVTTQDAVTHQEQKILTCSKEPASIAAATALVQTLNCAANEVFIKSASFQPQVYDHCALMGESSGLDAQGKDVCLASGMAGFKEYFYPGGVKTLLCKCPAGTANCNQGNGGTRASGSGGNIKVN